MCKVYLGYKFLDELCIKQLSNDGKTFFFIIDLYFFCDLLP